jgi:hypothetical protein
MKRAATVFLILLLLVLACQVFSNAPTSESGANQQPEGTDLAGYFLPDPAVGLDGLQSYTQMLSISFSGTQDGKTVEFTDVYEQELNREINTQFTYSTTTNAEGTQKTVFGNAGEAYYSKSGDEKCHISWGARAGNVEPFLPATFLPSLLAANEGGAEEVNGVQSQGYTFDAASLGYPSGTKVEGQVWLAAEGGYVVKYSMHIQDEGAFFGEGTKGEQSYEYELDQVNALSEPELPEGCLPVLTDFPAMADATDIQRLPEVLAYTSSSDISQVQSFYEQSLQDQGWTLSSSHPLSDGGTTLIFLRAEDSKIAYITLQPAGTNVWVTVKVEAMGEPMPGMSP